MGVHVVVRRQLGAADLAVAYDRLEPVRVSRRRASPDQRDSSRTEHAAALRRALPDDRRALAQRAGGLSFRAAPAARGIGCVDCRAKGRAQRPVLVPDHLGVHTIYRAAGSATLRDAAGGVLAGTARQADDGDAALRAAAARRVAAWPGVGRGGPDEDGGPGAGESAVVPTGGRRVGGDLPGAAGRRGGDLDGIDIAGRAVGECLPVLSDVPGPDGVACRAGRVLSVSAEAAVVAGRGLRGGGLGDHTLAGTRSSGGRRSCWWAGFGISERWCR